MEPRIQYAQTKDGVSIAFSTLGEGTPYVYMPVLLFSHLQLEWQNPEWRRWQERLAENRKVIRYDGRGSGLSDREVANYSLDALELDLEAVVDRLGNESFALYAPVYSGPVAIAYAARHQERVSHLVLWCSSARGSDFLEGTPQLETLAALRDSDWELYTETVAHVVFGWSEGEAAHRTASYMQECVTPDAWRELFSALREFDVTALLPQVRSPTLVLHRRQFSLYPVELSRGLASRIPNARLVLLEGASLAPYIGDMEAAASAIDEFLGEGEEVASGAEPTTVGTVHTILFTDVEGSTALTQRLGDAKARDVLRQHERMVREALKAHGGSEVKTMGDGFMASFSSATRALECAIAMQRAFAEHNESAEEPIKVRVGLNAGEPIAEDDDLFGTAVNEAARITATAKGGEILVSNVVRELAKGKDFLFADRGETSLKGFDESVRLFEVRWREEGGGAR
ncbi:MAG: adenylate/guanylate cyclase domain-containing protein [Chloroflexi bacterium]|nr:adenylate/guanylate cyclase domain-containing protein [Chloroflexota bacterium]